MTFKEALEVLVLAAARDAVGAGTGLRECSNYERNKEVARAISKVWPKVYDWKFSFWDAFNLGISQYIQREGSHETRHHD